MPTISKSGISPLQQIKSEHITRVIDALSGLTPNTNIVISGSITASYFVGDGSRLTNIPLSGSNFDSSSLATTGSNTFIGDQNIQGGVSIDLTDSGVVESGSLAAGLGNYSSNSSVSFGSQNISDGFYSLSTGQGNESHGDHSHAQGGNCITQLNSNYSHAEGIETITIGNGAHSEGLRTRAIGDYSHTEGRHTTSSGYASHVEGENNISVDEFQHIQGKFNIPLSGSGAFIIGNGNDIGSRSNLLYASGSQLEITGSLKVTGSITSSYFLGDGSGLTNIEQNISSFTSNIIFNLNNNITSSNIIILSDSIGDQIGEWTYLFTEYLADNYPSYTVDLRFWDTSSLTYQPPQTFQSGSGINMINVYIGGASGQGVSYGNINFNSLFPVEPDLVMISYGHNDNYSSRDLYKTEYLLLTKKIKRTFLKSQIILLAQNPKESSQPTFGNGVLNALDINYLAGKEGYGFINIMQKFFDYGNYSELLTDGIHPNSSGSLLWANEIKKAFPKNNKSNSVYPKEKQETIFVPVTSFLSNSGSLSFIPKAGDMGIPYIPLDPTTVNSIFSSIMLPYHWETINVYVYWTTPTNATGTNVFFNSYSYFLDETVLAPTLGGGAFVTAPGGIANKIQKTQIYSYLGSGEYSLEVKNTPFSFSITRLGTNVNDTYTDNCQVLGVLFERRL